MKTKIEVPKHGHKVKFNKNNPKFNELLARIAHINNEASVNLFLMIFSLSDTSEIRCTQCWKDTALLFHDMSDAMNELLELK